MSATATSTSDLKDLVDMLDELGIRAYTLHATDGRYYSERSPDATDGSKLIDLRLTIIGRTFFEQVCEALSLKATERVVIPGQRGWWAEGDTKTRRLLVEGVSFRHHDDWEAKAR